MLTGIRPGFVVHVSKRVTDGRSAGILAKTRLTPRRLVLHIESRYIWVKAKWRVFPLGPRNAGAIVAPAQLSYERTCQMPGKSKGGSGSDNRSAISGKYVTDSYAKSHPKTTVTERRDPPKKGK